MSEIIVRRTVEDVIFGLRCKCMHHQMPCDECPYANYSPHCELYIGEDAIDRLSERDFEYGSDVSAEKA